MTGLTTRPAAAAMTTTIEATALARALRALKLSGMLDTIDARLAQARAGELGSSSQRHRRPDQRGMHGRGQRQMGPQLRLRLECFHDGMSPGPLAALLDSRRHIQPDQVVFLARH